MQWNRTAGRTTATYTAILMVAAMAVALGLSQTAAAQTCDNTSLNGKYGIAGQGDIYTPLLDVLGIIQIGQVDTTVDTVGYIVSDGNGTVTAARLFESDNNGVSDTTYTGTYSITDCRKGTVSLTAGSKTLNFDIDLDHLLVPTGSGPIIAVTAQAEDTDPGRNEAFNLVHTLDPVGCGSTLNFDGRQTSGMQRGYTLSGQKMSAIISMDFASGGTFSGTQDQSEAGLPHALSPVVGSYTVNSDCTVTASRTINGVTEAGASVILSDGFRYLATPWIWQGESCSPSTDTYSSEDDAGAVRDQTYPVTVVC